MSLSELAKSYRGIEGKKMSSSVQPITTLPDDMKMKKKKPSMSIFKETQLSAAEEQTWLKTRSRNSLQEKNFKETLVNLTKSPEPKPGP